MTRTSPPTVMGRPDPTSPGSRADAGLSTKLAHLSLEVDINIGVPYELELEVGADVEHIKIDMMNTDQATPDAEVDMADLGAIDDVTPDLSAAPDDIMDILRDVRKGWPRNATLGPIEEDEEEGELDHDDLVMGLPEDFILPAWVMRLKNAERRLPRIMGGPVSIMRPHTGCFRVDKHYRRRNQRPCNQRPRRNSVRAGREFAYRAGVGE